MDNFWFLELTDELILVSLGEGREQQKAQHLHSPKKFWFSPGQVGSGYFQPCWSLLYVQ